ncbi:hypothetical protein [Salinisphaera sp. G21_0]
MTIRIDEDVIDHFNALNAMGVYD